MQDTGRQDKRRRMFVQSNGPPHSSKVWGNLIQMALWARSTCLYPSCTRAFTQVTVTGETCTEEPMQNSMPCIEIVASYPI